MQQPKKIRVIVADDSALMRKILSDIINGDSSLEVVATAGNGREALEKIAIFKPDVVTLDIEMPVMDGLETLEKIIKEHPLPVIMLSAFTQAGAVATIRALEQGAVDFLTKPGGSISPETGRLAHEIINKIKSAASIPAGSIKKQQAKITSERTEIKTLETAQPGAQQGKPVSSVIAIGTSTGGPKALHEVMSRLSNNLNSAIFIVQHMPPGFTKSLAQRLDAVSSFTVKEAEQGDEVLNRTAYVAPGDYHMEVVSQHNKLVIHLHQGPPVNGHRPSVDPLMKSVAKIPLPKVGVIMTGMGNDGAEGLKIMKEAGAVIIGESAETCVVYGMPRAAYQLGIVDYEAPVYRIAETIDLALKKNREA